MLSVVTIFIGIKPEANFLARIGIRSMPMVLLRKVTRRQCTQLCRRKLH